MASSAKFEDLLPESHWTASLDPWALQTLVYALAMGSDSWALAQRGKRRHLLQLSREAE